MSVACATSPAWQAPKPASDTAPTVAPATPRPWQVAVLEPENGTDAKIDCTRLGDAVRSAVTREAPSAAVLAREDTARLTGVKKPDGCRSGAEVETGKRIGADFVVCGWLSKVGAAYLLSLRLFEASTGRLLYGAGASGVTPSQLDGAIAPAVRTMLTPLRENAQPAQVQPPGNVAEFSDAMVAPEMISGPDPEYTPEAVDRQVEGVMVVRCVIKVEGSVEGCKVLRGLPYMDAAVVSALERRRYRPALLYGKPVAVYYSFKIRLTLPKTP